ncbi:MAG TPA: hypothetical protein VLZ83_04085 [Edaphocola sp.]|nr:hypothetical protein [Edaphocola sp.]
MYFIIFYPIFTCLVGYLVFKVFSIFVKNSLYKQKKKLSEIANDILDEFDLEDSINAFISPEKMQQLEPELKAQISSFIHDKIPEKLPALAMFKGDKLMFKAEEIVIEEVRIRLPEIIKKSVESANYKDQIKQELTKKILKIPNSDWEGLVNYWVAPFLGKLQLVGAVLGFILGLAYIIFMFLYNFIFLSQ